MVIKVFGLRPADAENFFGSFKKIIGFSKHLEVFKKLELDLFEEGYRLLDCISLEERPIIQVEFIKTDYPGTVESPVYVEVVLDSLLFDRLGSVALRSFSRQINQVLNQSWPHASKVFCSLVRAAVFEETEFDK